MYIKQKLYRAIARKVAKFTYQKVIVTLVALTFLLVALGSLLYETNNLHVVGKYRSAIHKVYESDFNKLNGGR